MKTHLYSESTNNIICKSHQCNGNSITVIEYLKMKDANIDLTYICSKCVDVQKKKHIKK
jgi:hypothetical protein